jgi:hypothetical protein
MTRSKQIAILEVSARGLTHAECKVHRRSIGIQSSRPCCMRFPIPSDFARSNGQKLKR